MAEEEKQAKEKPAEKKGLLARLGSKVMKPEEKTKHMEEAAQKKEPKTKEKPIKDPWKYLRFAHMTEKSINLIERENKLVFMADTKATKHEIKAALEKTFDVKIDEVKTMIDQKHRKKVFVRLAKEYSAADIAVRLGMI